MWKTLPRKALRAAIRTLRSECKAAIRESHVWMAECLAVIANSFDGVGSDALYVASKTASRFFGGTGVGTFGQHCTMDKSFAGVRTAALLQAAVTTNVDGLWQVHPSRLLEYSPQKLHTVGWFPW